MDVAVYDHLRPAGADYPDGVYRVVGVTDDRVTLLRVADADGSRVRSGRVERLDREALARFESAPNPDDGFAPVRNLLSAFEGYAALVRNRLP